MKRIAPDAICLVGAGLLGYGLWTIYEPLAFGFAGAMLIVAGVFLNQRLKKPKPRGERA